MKIKKVEIWNTNCNDKPAWHPVLIRLTTDDGITGVGEVGVAYGIGHSAAAGYVRDMAEQFVIGCDPFNTEKLWADIFRDSFWGQGGGPIVYGAMSAVDMALWDIKGKALGQPVYMLLGGKTNESLRTYASQIQFDWTERGFIPLSRPEQYAEADKQKKDEIETLNHADSLIYEMEKQLKENGEKLSAEDGREKEANLEIYIPNGPRLGNKVIEFHDVSKAYGDRLLFEHLSFTLPPAGIVGVIGPNGAGKTTLFRLIMGLEKPDSGDIVIGDTVKLAYVDQQHKSIDPDKTVYETIAENSDFVKLGKREVPARAYVSRFNFSGADQEKLCGVLSGGERNRLHLALTLKDEGNVLLLDEPTNDVDVNTIRALEEGLENFAGCAVVISHDRWFLDRIATHILAFEGDSQVYFFEGSYSEYEENKKRRLGNEEPKRFKYKKLME